MISKWTEHLRNDPKAKDKFEQYVKGSKELLNRLTVIIKELERDLDQTETELKQFDNPNWAYLQAYKNGCKGMLKKIQTLTTIE